MDSISKLKLVLAVLVLAIVLLFVILLLLASQGGGIACLIPMYL